uniref:cAMP-dependent protein kinase n=1 Tax=Alexandrium monilatum TaxID=311494 RepID=A0A7S4R7M8_9DINO
MHVRVALFAMLSFLSPRRRASQDFEFSSLFSLVRRGSGPRLDGAHRSGTSVPESSGKLVPVSHMKALIKGRLWGVADFDFGATVGTGKFGRVRVLQIKESRDRTPMAIKIMQKAKVIQLKQVEHVMAERQILAMVEHPFIISLLTTFQDETRLFMLLEYVNGGELFSYLRKEGRLPDDSARFYAGEIILAFSYLHSMSIVYRDLKPENLLIDCEGHTKITDFGFAKAVPDRTWTLCGTPEYLAPEIIQSKGHGKPVDWWALGILLFEMLAGYPPFYDDNPFGIYQKVLAGKIEFPRHFDVKAKDLIKRLLTNECGKRIGCLKSGAEDLKKHKWFKGMDWDLLLNRTIAPPFIPSVKSADDTTMFDKYPESMESSAPAIPAQDQALFEGFSAELP